MEWLQLTGPCEQHHVPWAWAGKELAAESVRKGGMQAASTGDRVYPSKLKDLGLRIAMGTKVGEPTKSLAVFKGHGQYLDGESLAESAEDADSWGQGAGLWDTQTLQTQCGSLPHSYCVTQTYPV